MQLPQARLSALASGITSQHVLVWGLFLVSGACGLIYEVLWTRQLGLIFGNTAHSLSAVLTAFMAGLALGSYAAGRLCHRLQRPLLVYGVLELAIGAYCAMLPWLFSDQGPLAPLYRSLYGEAGSGALGPARFAISFAALLIPTAFMGATLPVLSHFLVQTRSTLGRTVGTLYAINSFGAVLGAAGTGFVLLPELGKLSTNWLAVACNLGLGAVAVLLSIRTRLGIPVNVTGELPAEAVTKTSGAASLPVSDATASGAMSVVKLTVAAFGVTGFAAMVTQIGWTRAISLATGSSTYAFSLIVAVFILGLSAGGMWGARVAPKAADPLALLGRVLLLIGLLNLVVVALLGWGPILFYALILWTSEHGFAALLAAEALGVAALIIGPTFLMGATLPLTLHVASRAGAGAGRTVGTVYAVNTVGAILGSFLGGLVLLPVLQTQSMLELMAVLYAVPGMGLFILSPSRRCRGPMAATLAMTALAAGVSVWNPRWDGALMGGGLYLMVQRLPPGEMAAAIAKDCTLLYHKEGPECTVSVMKVRHDLTLRVGGKPEASGYGDMGTQVSLALAPSILHPTGARDVLVVGLGSGISVGAALAPATVERVDVAEMSPEVVDASWYFRDVNGLQYTKTEPRTLATPRLQLLLNDARNHLLLTSRTYDVIASEPSNPWMAGIGNLFTKEAFELAKSRLKPGGIMCQWIHTYQLEGVHVSSVIRTFGGVFRHAQLWQSQPGDLLLIGSEEPLRVTPDRLRERLAQPAVRGWLARVHMDGPAQFLAAFAADDGTLRARRSIAQAVLHTDDNMYLEFQAPRTLYQSRQPFSTYAFMPCPEFVLDLSGVPVEERAAFTADLDRAVAAREHMLHTIGSRDEHAKAALALDPYQYLAVEYANKEDQDDADRLLLGAGPKTAPDPAGAVKLLERAEARSKFARRSRQALNYALADDAKRLIKAGEADAALAQLDKIAAPEHADATALLRARALMARKDYAKALDAANEAIRTGRQSIECTALVAEILSRSGRKNEALDALENIVIRAPKAQRDPATAPLWYARAELLAEQQKLAEALQSAQKAVDLDSKNAAYLRLEGRLQAQNGNLRTAVDAMRRHAALAPGSLPALVETAETLLGTAERLTPERMKEEPRLAQQLLLTMRRVGREATVLHPEEPQGWEMLCRSHLALAKADPASAAFHRREADRTFQALLALYKGERSKAPADLAKEFGP
jgi:spermidine synthase